MAEQTPSEELGIYLVKASVIYSGKVYRPGRTVEIPMRLAPEFLTKGFITGKQLTSHIDPGPTAAAAHTHTETVSHVQDITDEVDGVEAPGPAAPGTEPASLTSFFGNEERTTAGKTVTRKARAARSNATTP